jgi:hypothetical protein
MRLDSCSLSNLPHLVVGSDENAGRWLVTDPASFRSVVSNATQVPRVLHNFCECDGLQWNEANLRPDVVMFSSQYDTEMVVENATLKFSTRPKMV